MPKEQPCEEYQGKTTPQLNAKVITKVLLMSELESKTAEEVERLYNVLLNGGYRPILINNTMVVLAKVVQVP